MDTITDILEGLKKRFTNPFVLSFILSWSIYNWQIPVALLWYDNEHLKRSGYSSIYDLINCVASREWSVAIPICFAIGYGLASAFGFPAVRYYTTWFKAWITKKQEDKILFVTKDSSIPTSKYITLRAQYDSRSKILEDHIKSESATQAQLEKVTNEKFELSKDINDLKNQLALNNQAHSDGLAKKSTEFKDTVSEMQHRIDVLTAQLSDYTNTESIEGVWQVTYIGGKHPSRFVRFMNNTQEAPPLSIVQNYTVVEIMNKPAFVVILCSSDNKQDGLTCYTLEREGVWLNGFENDNRVSLRQINEESIGKGKSS